MYLQKRLERINASNKVNLEDVNWKSWNVGFIVYGIMEIHATSAGRKRNLFRPRCTTRLSSEFLNFETAFFLCKPNEIT